MISGSCHCGAVTFAVDGGIDQAIECNCSHCSRKGLLLWFVPRGALALSSGAERLTTYTFNTHRIRHASCPDCSVQVFGLGSMPDGTAMAAINIRCLDGVDLASVERVAVNGREL